MNTFLPFSEITEKIYGGKANNLAILYQNGFNVPNGFVITSNTLESIKIKETEYTEIKKWVTNNQSLFDTIIQEAWLFSKKLFVKNTTLAIRSSVNLEDGNKHSFAGQFTSVLEIQNYDTFKKAFITCLLSKYNAEPIAYCKSNAINPEDLKLNIIVQEMVQADFSGVCFSVNPITGNEKEMLIDFVDGLGEQLVQGQITPSSYKVNWFEDKIIEKKIEKNMLLSEELAFSIVEQSLQIQQFYGLAQDIEWAIKEGVLYILQARPLTTIQFETKYDWTNADLKDGGISSEITTPFMYKLYETAFETTMYPYLKSVKIHPPNNPDKWFTQFMLFSYWNISATKEGVKKIPGFIEKDFDEDLGIEARYNGKGHITKISLKSIIEGVQILFSINKAIKNTIKNAKESLQILDNSILKNKNINWATLSDAAFISNAKTLITEDYLKVEGAYFEVIYNNSNYTTLFKELLTKKNKKGTLHYLKLITGLQNLTHLQPSFAIWRLSRVIRKNEEAFDFYIKKTSAQIGKLFLSKEDFPLRDELVAIITKYGFHSEKELNILTPNWRENPTQLLGTLKNFLTKEDNESIIDQNKKQKIVFEEEYQKIKSKKLRKEVLKHRYLLWLREEYRDRSTQMYDVIRNVYVIAGKRLVDRGVLKDVSDVFFVHPNAVENLFNKDPKQLDVLKKNKIIYSSFRNFVPPNEIWSTQWEGKQNNIESTDALKGIACSYGIIEAEVFIAKTTKDADTMPEGKILVTQFTDPAWTVYFSKIKGLITETGGILSHGAIISREYGIPAVLGVSNSTNKLKTGDMVRLNGSNGIIEIINSTNN